MAARVNDTDVQQILSTSKDTTPFIIAANLMVTKHLGNSGLSTDVLKEIERWVAAHVLTMSTGSIKSKKVGEATDIYVTPPDTTGLNGTRFGQMAVLLDSTGTLATLGRRKASFDSLSITSE